MSGQSTTPVGRVTAVLLGAKYRLLGEKLSVSGLNFEFAGIFIGDQNSLDLILLVDTALDKEKRIFQKVEAFARALDIARSRRPLSLVIVGPRPSTPILESLSRICRVLPVEATDTQAIENALAVLLPLTLPEPRDELHAAVEVLAGDLDQPHQQIISKLIEAAAIDTDSVQETLVEAIEAPFGVKAADSDEVSA